MNGPFARGNNFDGRVSWSESYRLLGLIRLAQLTGHPVFKDMVRTSVAGLLSITNDRVIADPTLPPKLWATRKYSRDRTSPLNLLADDAIVVYAMLRAANADLVDSATQRNVVAVSRAAFDHFEKDFDVSTGQYRFPYGIPFHLDGVWVPINMQNAMGLMCLELWLATKESRFRQRALALADTFRQQWVSTQDQRVLWHYWPAVYYRGWSADARVSRFMPERPASTDNLFEDMSHAGWSVQFVSDARRVLGDEAFSLADIEGLRRSLGATLAPGAFHRFMSATPDYEAASLRFAPTFGWTTLGSRVLSRAYARGLPTYDPPYDVMHWLPAVLALVDGDLDDVNVLVTRLDGTRLEIQRISPADQPEFWGFPVR
jgi:hypothetical protein